MEDTKDKLIEDARILFIELTHSREFILYVGDGEYHKRVQRWLDDVEGWLDDVEG